MNVRACAEADLPRMMLIWNQVVEDGVAFPQLDLLTPETARAFFAAQSFTAVAEENGEDLLVPIEDDAVFDEIAEIFEERLSDLYEVEELESPADEEPLN